MSYSQCAHLAPACAESSRSGNARGFQVDCLFYSNPVHTILTATAPPVLSIGSLSLNVLSRELTGPAGTVRLHRGPYLVLRDLMRRPGIIVSLGQMVETAWPEPDQEPNDPEKAVRMAVRRARDALENVGVPGNRLKLAFQAGYVMQRDPMVVRLLTAEQAAMVDRLLASQQPPEQPCI